MIVVGQDRLTLVGRRSSRLVIAERPCLLFEPRSSHGAQIADQDQEEAPGS